MKAIYCRVSTVAQNTDRQLFGMLDQSSSGHDWTVYEDKVSGVTPFADRPAGRRLMQDAEKGKVSEVHFWEVSRVGRDVMDMTQTLYKFAQLGVQVVIRKEGINLLNPDGSLNPSAQVVLSVMTALSSIERHHIRERQKEGIAVAKAQGRYIGRRTGTRESTDRFLTKPKSQKISRLLDEGYPLSHISSVLGVSPTTVVKVKRLLQTM